MIFPKIIRSNQKGFTLLEVLMVIALIGILSSVVLFSVNDARATARDKQRMVDLKQLELALALYYEANGSYPDQGCGAPSDNTTWTGPGDSQEGYMTPQNAAGCDEYIDGLAPNFIPTLPLDPKFEDDSSKPGWGYIYKTDGQAYKVLSHLSVENIQPTSNDDEFARRKPGCTGVAAATPVFQPTSYGVAGGSTGLLDGNDSACW